MRLVGIVIAAALVVYLLFHGIRLLLLVRTGAELVQRSKPFERRNEAGTPRILILGDSTGVGTGADPVSSIAGRFGKDFPNAFVQNESRNGWKVADAVQNFPSIPEKSVDIILLQIGANDILRGTPLAAFSVSLDELFKKSTTAGRKVFALHSGNVGLAPFFPWPLTRIMRARTLRYRSEYQRIAALNGVTYVDLYHEAANDPFQGKHEFYADDLLHLSASGYEVWYQAIRATMQ